MGTEKQRGMWWKSLRLAVLLVAMLAGSYGVLNVVYAVSESGTPVGELLKACLPPPVYHTLTVLVSPEGAPNVTVTLDPPGPNYIDDSEVSLTASGTPDYRFDHWERALAGEEGETVTLVMDEDKEVEAVYIPQYDLTTSTTGNGDISPESGTYDEDTEVRVTANPDPLWRFGSWTSDNVFLRDGEYYVLMDEDQEVSATFIQQGMLYTYVSPSNSGQVTPSGGTYDVGTGVPLLAQQGEGYAFDYWSGDLSSNNQSDTVTMASPTTSVTANFVPEYEITVTVDGDGTGSVEISPDPPYGPRNCVVTLTANAGDCSVFDKWDDGETIPSTREVTLTSDLTTLKVYFAASPSIVPLTIQGQGTVIDQYETEYEGPGTFNNFCSSGSVTCTAVPFSAGCWLFSHWEDGNGGTLGTDPFFDGNIGCNGSLTAVFSQGLCLDAYALGGGTVGLTRNGVC